MRSQRVVAGGGWSADVVACAGFAVADVLLSALDVVRPGTGRTAAFSMVFAGGSLSALLASLAYGASGAGVTAVVGACLALMYGVV